MSQPPNRIRSHAPQSKTLTRLRGSQAAFPPHISNYYRLTPPVCCYLPAWTVLSCATTTPPPFNHYDCTATAPLRFAFASFLRLDPSLFSSLLRYPSSSLLHSFERERHPRHQLPSSSATPRTSQHPHPEGRAQLLLHSEPWQTPTQTTALSRRLPSGAPPTPFPTTSYSLAAVIRSHRAPAQDEVHEGPEQ